MSLKDRFANHSENAAEQPQPEEQKSVELYDTAGHARNICFVQTTGESIFLSYAYLCFASFNPDRSTISLTFTTHQVVIKGNDLGGIFDSIFSQQIKTLKVNEKRYDESPRIEKILITFTQPIDTTIS